MNGYYIYMQYGYYRSGIKGSVISFKNCSSVKVNTTGSSVGVNIISSNVGVNTPGSNVKVNILI